MIYVKDLDGMSAFYSDTLGLKPVEETRSDTWAELESGGAGVALHVIPPRIADQMYASGEHRSPRPKRAHQV
jgi:catechol 2,3-dioxygenase-like lactoylglutathione lyase family enzyme